MKAAVLREFKQPLVIEQVPTPVPGPNDVLIQVEACGVCHSDLHVADGDWPQLAPIVKKPVILGHEIAGHIVESGAAVQELKIGERVGVPWIYWTCGECEFCREGNENLCVRQQITGVTVDGGYAEFVKAPASHTTKIPANLSSADAAPLFCAGITVHRALKQGKISAGQRVAVFGVGGLGHLAIQLAQLLGAEVTAIDISGEKLALAKSLGAAHTINASSGDAIRALRAQGGVHVALVTSAAKSAYNMAFSSVRPTGTLLVVGLPADDLCFAPILMAASEIKIRASAVGTRKDLRELLDIASAGKLHLQVTTRPIQEVNHVLDELRLAQISGRVVLTPS
jgi:propanol-preferring alcohol dehydrogenase